MRDFDGNFLRSDGADDAADFAVVERNRFAGANAIEKFRKRDADVRRADQLLFLVVLRGLAGIERPREYERVADIEPKRLRLRRNCSDLGEAQRLCDSPSSARVKLKREPGDDVGGAGGLGPAAVAVDAGNLQGAGRAAGVGEADAVAGL